MALARLKTMLHFADGTPDVPGGPSTVADALRAMYARPAAPAPVKTAGPPASSMQWWGPDPNAAAVRGMAMAPPGNAPIVPAAAVAPVVGPVTSAMPSAAARPAVASAAEIARWGVGGPDSGGAGPMFPAAPRQQIRAEHVGDVNPNPNSGGPVDVIRAGRYGPEGGGGGMPLQARIALMTQPASEMAARSLLAASQTVYQNEVSALLQKYNNDETAPGYIRERQQRDAQHQLDLQRLAFQQFGLMQLMQQPGAMNANQGGYGALYPGQ